ncbi:hypothetical protein ZIOFF_024955 [Zingiber officinale]|uniref:GOLD domain-containing protein n=1 Tax=Zingiber officinale TaxID=94328 RepID=A0A8J5GX36_ZINOF|nr:hypothetical protein ZIOFF_024955 [Zingiber officinale]
MGERATRGRRCSAGLCAFALALAVVSLLLARPACALRFELESGHTKCVSEDIKLHSMAVGKYSVVNPYESTPLPESHKITVRVTSPYGNSIHYQDQVESGNFAFTANEEGDYLACLWAPYHKPAVTMAVEFEWRTGLAAKDWTNVAKKGQIEVIYYFSRTLIFFEDSIFHLRFATGMELELKKLEDTFPHDKNYDSQNMRLLIREEQMQDMNRSTNSRMAWLSFLSLAVCASVAGLQLWHLKTFFERKKLL